MNDNISSINFTGGFLIRKPGKKMWQNFESILPKKKVLFQQYNDEGDKFIVVKSVRDKLIADFILEKRLDFKFYPDITLKDRPNLENVKQFQELVNLQTGVIDTRKELREFVKPVKKPFKLEKYHWKSEDHISQIFKALSLNSDDYVVSIDKGITTIKDKTGKTIVKASPNSHNGINYVYVMPKNTDESPQRFAISYKGEIVYRFSLFEKENFNKNFMQTVKIDLGRTRPQK